MPRSPVMLVILDGFGINLKKEGNAIQLADAPTFRALEKGNHSKILTSGEAVGLPDGQMGNSEVGHTNMGAGRIVYQDLTRINKAISGGDFFKNPILKKSFEAIQKKGSKLHLAGLLSDGGVHSHIEHLFALLKFAKNEGLSRIYIHAFLDGRDTPYNSSPHYLRQFESFKIATVSGRYYAMDRDKRWDRTERAYDAMTKGIGLRANSPLDAIEEAFQRGETDEFMQPTIIDSEGLIEDNDFVIFFNFRSDRARQLTQSLNVSDFSFFKRKKIPKLTQFMTMTQYDQTYSFPVIFPPIQLVNILGEILARNNIAQLRISETEKYAHVTFFFNGGEERVFPGEERILIPSPRDIPTYDLKPQMSAPEITETVIKNLEKREFGFIILNFANADMVGHSGNLPAAIKSVEILDNCVEKIIRAVQAQKGHLLITADHGNVEQMIDYETGDPHTMHTTNPVPFYYMDPERKKIDLKDGILADFMPTILNLLKIESPKEATGKNLIVE